MFITVASAFKQNRHSLAKVQIWLTLVGSGTLALFINITESLAVLT